MAIEVNITPEDIDSMVKDAILKAGLGKVIMDALSKLFTGYNNPVDEQLKRYVGIVCSELIREKFSAQIRASCMKVIEEKVTNEVIDKMTNEAARRLEKATDSSY